MPVHDWLRVDAGVFHAFHMGWMWELQEEMNARRLPPDFYALVEQHATEPGEDAARYIADLLTLHVGASSEEAPLPPSAGGVALAEAPPKVRHRVTLEPNYRLQRRTLAIRHVSGHRLVAVVEMVSPANKDRLRHVEQFALKITALLEAAIHVLLIDLLPPGACDPRGMHGAIGRWIEDTGTPSELPADEPLTLASYRAAGSPEAYLDHLSVGRMLPDMPLFIGPGHYVDVPLEMTYGTAFAAMPQYWREVLQRVATDGNGRQRDP